MAYADYVQDQSAVFVFWIVAVFAPCQLADIEVGVGDAVEEFFVSGLRWGCR